MPQRHVLAPLRRWLTDAGSPQKMAAVLLVATLMIATALTMLSNERGGSTSDMIEIENTGHGL